MSVRMKCALFLSLLLLVPAARAVTARADLFDPCDDPEGPGRYRGLSLPEEDYIGWASPPDSSYLCQSSNRRQASATYHCPGAEEAVVAIYSRHGCWAGRDGDALFRGGEDLPLGYSPGDDEVYCGGRRMVYDGELMDFVFLEEEERPSGLENYGLGAAVSSDGEDFVPASCTLLSVEREGAGSYFYEVYRVELEGDWAYLRLTLTDQSSVQILGRAERYRFETAGGLSLASVEIVGEEPPPEPPAPEEPSRPPDPPAPEAPSLPQTPSVPPDGESPPPSSGGENPLPPAPSLPGGETSPAGPLPTLPPEEGEDPHGGGWGPAWTEEGEDGPAFPEEPAEGEGAVLSRREAAEKADRGESSSGGSRSKGKESAAAPAETSAETPVEGGRDEGAEGMIAARRPLEETAVPARHRWLEPEMMTTLSLSAALLAVGLRLLWKK